MAWLRHLPDPRFLTTGADRHRASASASGHTARPATRHATQRGDGGRAGGAVWPVRSAAVVR
eukprot:2849492-Prymnesium_polylepis.1